MQKIKFWKMSGAGNDFVLITGGRRDTKELQKLAILLCAPKAAVGADGLLFVNRAGSGLVNVRYFNSDGSEAFCGNGSRCAAWWAYSRGLAGKKFTLKTLAGDLQAAVVSAENIEMCMPDVSGARLRFAGRYPRGVRTVHFLNTGVPHAVVPVKNIDKTDVDMLGRALRHNPAFGKAGANVNFAEKRGGLVLVRTYERGVEGETLACGTGLTATAVALVLAGGVKSPVNLASRSGEKFRVRLKSLPGGASDINILGPAKITFEGEIIC